MSDIYIKNKAIILTEQTKDVLKQLFPNQITDDIKYILFGSDKKTDDTSIVVESFKKEE